MFHNDVVAFIFIRHTNIFQKVMGGLTIKIANHKKGAYQQQRQGGGEKSVESRVNTINNTQSIPHASIISIG
jgi:hypothetical protein